MQIGMYVAVSNLERAKEFYSTLFGTTPYVENKNFVGFRVGGGTFGLMRADAYAYPMDTRQQRHSEHHRREHRTSLCPCQIHRTI